MRAQQITELLRTRLGADASASPRAGRHPPDDQRRGRRRRRPRRRRVLPRGPADARRVPDQAADCRSCRAARWPASCAARPRAPAWRPATASPRSACSAASPRSRSRPPSDLHAARRARLRPGRRADPQLPHGLLLARAARPPRRGRDGARARRRGRRRHRVDPGRQGPGRRVLAVVSSDEKERVAREAGADEVLRSDGAWKDEAKEPPAAASTSCSTRSAATASPTACARSARAAALVVVGFTGGSIPEVRVNRLLLNNTRGRRRRLGRLRARQARGQPRDRRGRARRWPSRASCAPIVGARFPLERADRGAAADRRPRRARQGRAGALSRCSCVCNYFRLDSPHREPGRGRDEARGPPPHHDDHRRRPGATSTSTPTCSGCGSSRRPSTSTRPTPTTCTSATSRARPARSSPGSSSPAPRRGRAGVGMIHTLQLGVASEAALDFWAERLGTARERRGERSLRFDDHDGLALELVVADAGNPPLRAEHPEIPAEHAITGIEGARAYGAFAPVEEGAAHRRRSASRTRAAASTASRAASATSAGPTTRRRPTRGRQGAGTVHHIAWASRDEDHLAWQERVARRRRLRHRRPRPRLLPARSTSASRAACCSRSRRSRPASPSTRTRSTSARRCACPRSTSTCARSSSSCCTPVVNPRARERSR